MNIRNWLLCLLITFPCMSFAAINQHLAYLADLNRVAILDLDAKSITHYLRPSPHASWQPYALALSPDKKLAVVLNRDFLQRSSSLALIDLATGQQISEIHALKGNEYPETATFSPDGKYIYIGIFHFATGDTSYRNGEIAVYDIQSQQVSYIKQNGKIAHSIHTRKIIFDPSGERAIAIIRGKTSGYSQMMVIDTKSQSILDYDPNYRRNVADAIFSPDGKRLYLVLTSINLPKERFFQDAIKIIDWQNNKEIKMLHFQRSTSSQLKTAITPDGRKLFIANLTTIVSFDTQAEQFTTLKVTPVRYLMTMQLNKEGTALYAVEADFVHPSYIIPSVHVVDAATNNETDNFQLTGIATSIYDMKLC